MPKLLATYPPKAAKEPCFHLNANHRPLRFNGTRSDHLGQLLLLQTFERPWSQRGARAKCAKLRTFWRMTDDDRADLWDEEDDGPELLTDESASQWASDNREELKAMFDTDAYHAAVLDAHQKIFPIAIAELEKARRRLGEGDYPATAFHAARTLEGYVRAVYLVPLTHVMTVGIAAGLKTGAELARRFIPNQIKDTGALLTLGLSVFFADEPKVFEQRKIVLGAFAPESAWSTRNEADHTLNQMDHASALAILEHAERCLPMIAMVPTDVLQQREADRRRQVPPRAQPWDFGTT